ncbi:MAG TPA: plastocyanin/azurin family copper-binding protein [Gemmatimonadaceae bacterium]
MDFMKAGLRLAAAGGCAFFLACGGGGEKPAEEAKAPPTPTVTPGSPLTPAEGGKVIVIEMSTDEKGNNKFSPNDFEAHQGDVMRFTLGTGVHNVHFLADSNRTLTSPPAASPLLQLPGQTYDIAVDFPEGRYYFQCDPHALLGMIGHVKVESRD